MRYYFIPIRMATILKSLTFTSVGEDVEKLGPLRTVGGKVRQWQQATENVFLQKIRNGITI